jgi:hypothetical protein
MTIAQGQLRPLQKTTGCGWCLTNCVTLTDQSLISAETSDLPPPEQMPALGTQAERYQASHDEEALPAEDGAQHLPTPRGSPHSLDAQ